MHYMIAAMRGISRVPRWAPLLLAAVLAQILSVPARADSRVTLCADADQGGFGVNLRSALAAAVNVDSLINVVTFGCKHGAIIRVRTPLGISKATRIDGGQSVTLAAAGPAHTPMFTLAPTAKFFYLVHLSIVSTPVPAQMCLAKARNAWPDCGLTRILSGHDVVELNDVTVTGMAYPLQMQSGSISISGSRFQGNSGAVLTANGPTAVTVSQSRFSNNSEVSLRVIGSLRIDSNSSFTHSGTLILWPGTTPCALTIERSSFDSNGTSDFGAILTSCDVNIGHSTFTGNVAGAPGGALNLEGQLVTLRADQFLSNRSGVATKAKSGGGAIAWRPAGAGGLMTVLFSTFSQNQASGAGGAIMVGQNSASPGPQVLNIGATAFSHNTAQDSGGAIAAYSAHLNTARVAFAGNAATNMGGALLVANATALSSTLANTLMVRNTAGTGSAFSGDAAKFVNSTVAANTGVGIAVTAAGRTPVQVALSNTIVSNNTNGECAPARSIKNLGNNLQFPASDCGAEVPVADPQLDSMYIPLPRSPPMGHGNVAVCMGAPVGGADFYGVARAANNVCAIGAAEGDVQVLGGGWTAYRNPPAPGNNNQNVTAQLLELLKKAGISAAWLKAQQSK